MSLLEVIPAFALTALVLAMVPGQSMAMVLRQTVLGGARTGYVSVLGNATGLALWGGASAVGLSQIFAHSPLAYNLLKYAGVAYLSLLALNTLRTLRHESGVFDAGGEARVRPRDAFRLGLFTNLTNVMAAVFAVAFLPQFVPRTFPLSAGVLELAGVQALVSTTWYFSLVASIDRASRYVARARVRRWLTGVSAGGLLTLAAVLLLSAPR